MNKGKREFILSFLLAFCVVFLTNTFIAKRVVVQGESMYPTLTTGNEGVSFVPARYIVNRFDVVILNVTKNGELMHIIKRVVGMPGETIEYKDNQLYINDKLIIEKHPHTGVVEDFVIELKDDEYFCMGDNRENSLDSRHYGPFAKNQIVSNKMIITNDFERLGLIP